MQTPDRPPLAELERVRSKLQQSEAELRQLIDAIPQQVCVFDARWNPVFANQREREYTGLTVEEAQSRDALGSLFHPDDRKRLEAVRERAFREAAPFELEARLRSKDGQYRWFLIRDSPLRDEQGRILRWYGTRTDIEDRKRAEDALGRSRAYLTEAQLLSHTGSFGWNVATDEHTWSEETFRIFEYDPSRNITLPLLLARVHPEDRTIVREMLERAAQERRDFDHEHRLLMPDGSVKHLHVVAHAAGQAPENVEFIGAVMDVTAQKRAEDALRLSEAVLAEAQRISHTGSWVWKPATGEMTSSKERFRILGFDPETTELSCDVFWERVHPEDKPGLTQALDSAIREKRDFEHEYRIVTPDWVTKRLQTAGHAVVNESGELVEFIGTTMDITDRKGAEEALHQAQARLAQVTRLTMVGELAASIAHEVNQPLAGLVTSANACLNWLAHDPPNLFKAREALERILRDGTRAGGVLTRIRALLKKASPTKSRVSVNQIVRDVLALTRGELRQNEVELSVELDSNLPLIMGDHIQLQQVLLNLIMNAVEAMAGITWREKTLRIRSELGDLDGKAAVSVKVSDTGLGFNSKAASRLFEPFYTTKVEGLGIGLWISRSIIEGHGGRLSAQSNDGPGATFWVLLPAETGGSE